MSKIFYSDDGVVGISVEIRGANLRFFDAVPKGLKPKYQGIAQIENWADDVAAIKAAHGAVLARHMALIVQTLDKANFKWLYTERIDGVTPLSVLVTEGPFTGWWLTDIEKALERAKRRYPRSLSPIDSEPST